MLGRLDKRRSYFTVQQFAGLMSKEGVSIPCDLKLTIFVGGGPDDRPFAPHVTFVPIPLLSKLLTPSRRPRKQLATFAGGFLFWQDYKGIRTDMRTRLQNETGFQIRERDPNWEELIRGSVFHLCPRGNGPTSYRLFESLQAGTIPIYIWEEVKWLPFDDVIDWERLAVVVPRSEIASIPERIAKVDAAAMRANILKSRNIWQYNYTSEYILTRVRRTANDAGLSLYRPNSTECNSAKSTAGAAVAASSTGINAGGSLASEALQGRAAAVLAETTLAIDGVMAKGVPLHDNASFIVHTVQEITEENYHVGRNWDYGKGHRQGFSRPSLALITVTAAIGFLVLIRSLRRRRTKRGFGKQAGRAGR